MARIARGNGARTKITVRIDTPLYKRLAKICIDRELLRQTAIEDSIRLWLRQVTTQTAERTGQ